MKRSQITLVMIVVIFVILALTAVIFVNSTLRENRSELTTYKSVSAPLDLKLVRNYFESCLRQVSYDSLVISGRHGGYFSPAGNTTYGDLGCDNYSSYNGTMLPLFVSGDTYFAPQLGDITELLRRYVAVEIVKCLDLAELSERNYYLSIPYIDWQAIGFDFDLAHVNYSYANVNVSIFPGSANTIFQLTFPVLVRKGASSSMWSDFFVNLDVPLGAIYQNASALCSQLVTEEFYNVSLHCEDYSSVSSILFLNSTLVRFVSNSSGMPFFFDFAVKNSSLAGQCG
ncbi:MAG: hypothetical protein ABIF10_06570 [Candidatus Woesearchaeota archaeon]